MKGQKKKQSGITLIALVISIIVMSILAGVSLNATIGENGIVTQAQEAVLQQRIASQLEELNLELAKLNVDTISSDSSMAIQDIAEYLVSQGTIDSCVTTSAGQIAAGIDNETGNRYFFGIKGDNTYRIMRASDGLLTAELTTNTSGGDITGGYALITADNFNNDDTLPEEEKGKFTITDNAEVVFMDTVTGELSIKVNAGVHATVGIYADMTLTNQNISRSAIDIEPTGILDLYIGEDVTLTVNSGYAEQPSQGAGVVDGYGAIGGNGGYAGIHCWKANKYTGDYDGNGTSDFSEGTYSTLNLSGAGTLICYGGDASDGLGSAGSGDSNTARFQ